MTCRVLTGSFSMFLLLGAIISLIFPADGNEGKFTERASEVYTELTVYESKDTSFSRFIKYSEYPNNDFADLPDDYGKMEEMSHRWTPVWMCYNGVFLFYKKSHYSASTEDELTVYMGEDKCTAAPKSEQLGSLRVAGDWMNYDNKNSLILYREPNLGGLGDFTAKDKRYFERDLKHFQTTKSMLFVFMDMNGKFVKWSIKTKLKNTYCMTPQSLNKTRDVEKDIRVCIIPDLEPIFYHGSEVDDYTITEINKTMKCLDGSEVIEIKNCFDYYTGELIEPAIEPPIEPERNKTNNKGNEWSPFYGTDCENITMNFTELALLMRMRVTTDFASNYQFILPLDKQHLWRTQLLDSSFEILTSLLSPSIVPSWFIGSLREYFIYFIEAQSWSNGTAGNITEDNHDYKVVLHQTRKCFDNAHKWDMLPELQSAVAKETNKFNVNLKLIAPQLKRKTKYDPITEFVWLSIHLVGVACHQVLKHTTDFWLDYTHVATEMYLRPMANWWLEDSKEEQKYYPIIFGGANFTKMYDATGIFTTAVYNLLKRKKILDRPNWLANKKQRAGLVAVKLRSGGDDDANEATPTAVPDIKPTTAKAPGTAATGAPPKRRKRQGAKKGKKSKTGKKLL